VFNGKPTVSGYKKSDEALSNLQHQILEKEFQGRVATACFVNDVYARHFHENVRELLKAQFNAETFEAMQLDIRTSINVLADVVNKLAVAWAEGATYALTDEAGDYDDADGAFSSFLSVAGFDDLGRALDRKTELHPRIAVGPRVCMQERSGRRVFTWSVYDPSSFMLMPSEDNPSDFVELDTYGWTTVNGVRRQSKVLWRSDVVCKMVLNQQQRWEILSEEENPYGVIPFVLFAGCNPVDELWPPCIGSEMADVTVSVCAAETMLANQSLSQIKVLAGEFKDFPRGQNARQCGLINVGDAQNLNLLDYQTNVPQFSDVFVQRPRRNALSSVDLPSDEFDATGMPPSGEALKMRYSNRDRRAVHKRPHLKKSMVELFWMSQHVLATKFNEADKDGVVRQIEGITSLIPYDAATMTSSLTFSIDVNEITYPELAAERAAAEDRDLSLGLTNLAELYMRRNPDATREQAMQAVVLNRALNVKIGDNATMRRIGPVSLRTEPAALEAAVLAR